MENNNQSFFVIGIIDRYVKSISGNWWIVFSTGVVAILLGASFIVWPAQALEVSAYFIGIAIIFVGLAYIINSFKIKRIKNNYEKVKERIKSSFD